MQYLLKKFSSSVLLVTQLAYAEIIVGRVVGVADGDTITVLDSSNAQHKVRLAGIDAPRTKLLATSQRNHYLNWCTAAKA